MDHEQKVHNWGGVNLWRRGWPARLALMALAVVALCALPGAAPVAAQTTADIRGDGAYGAACTEYQNSRTQELVNWCDLKITGLDGDDIAQITLKARALGTTADTTITIPAAKRHGFHEVKLGRHTSIMFNWNDYGNGDTDGDGVWDGWWEVWVRPFLISDAQYTAVELSISGGDSFRMVLDPHPWRDSHAWCQSNSDHPDCRLH